MSFIVYQSETDPTRVFILSPTGEVSLGELIQRHVTTPYKICNAADIADLDNTFVGSWQLENDVVIVNMPNARNEWRDKLRAERTPLLQQLDIAYMKALELNNTAELQEIALKKQKLRDAPSHPSIEAAQTTSELKALTLDILTA